MRTLALILFYSTIACAGILLAHDWLNGLPTITAAIFGITVGSGALVAAFCTDEWLG